MNKSYCAICGKEIPTYSFGDFFPWQCLGHSYPVNSPSTFGFGSVIYVETTKKCEHCYCREEEIDGKKHKKCCMCGNRKLI